MDQPALEEKGRFRLGPLPPLKRIVAIPCTHIVSLLTSQEFSIGEFSRAVRFAKKQWTWFPLVARPWSHEYSPMDKFFEAARAVYTMLQENESVYLHCKGGVHRTGMVAWVVFRLAGLTPEQTQEEIKTLQPITLIDRFATDAMTHIEEEFLRREGGKPL